MKTRQFTEDQIVKLLQAGKKGEKSLKNPALKVQGFKVRLEVASILKNKY